MTNSNQTPVGFTPNAFEYFKTFYKRATGNDLTNDQVTTWFDDISHFQPDGSAHIEVGSHLSLSGHPEVADFDADDFIYA